MICEDYVSFETAKLLKEKGFDGDTNCYYIEGSVDKNLCYSPMRQNHNKRLANNEFDIDINISSGKISAPTLQMAMKWLRKEHNIHVGVRITNHGMTIDIIKYYWVMTNTETGRWCDESTLYTAKAFDTPEEAEEDAIRHALEKLD